MLLSFSSPVILACEQALAVILVCSVGFLLIDTELHGSTTEVKSFKMSHLALNLFNLTLKDITSFICRLLKTI